ncbi:NRDE family protein [Anaeromyxobacter oryzae]|uniref:NRDE family protein n=1 Tax=Anaeromyxobacter oryzae TaxID=2918170 RepID=A0ABM7WSX6_9BACT|nr:NRDE family protein [Anaeromyxobacter oryzae]BDG02589.1 hypothetical protein AMOR_15850 [Anaeromyxobacter oryzae]
MCTLAVAFQTDRRWPVIVAANRDERLGRAAEGWAIRSDPDGGRYAAPRDLLAGGTWIGVSERGLVAALTNFHAPATWYPDPARRSRGELVPLALRAPDAATARTATTALDAHQWNPFHLVVADARDAFLWWYDGETAAVEPLAPGLHVVTETSPHGDDPRSEVVRARWPLDPSIPRLHDLLTRHAPVTAFGAATCIHMDPAYGTRSSAILRLAPDLAASELYATDARPCLAPHEDRSALLAALARSA